MKPKTILLRCTIEWLKSRLYFSTLHEHILLWNKEQKFGIPHTHDRKNGLFLFKVVAYQLATWPMSFGKWSCEFEEVKRERWSSSKLRFMWIKRRDIDLITCNFFFRFFSFNLFDCFVLNYYLLFFFLFSLDFIIREWSREKKRIIFSSI